MPDRASKLVEVRSFAGAMASLSTVVSPRDDAAWSALFAAAPARGVTVRGMGASYSDAALNSGGTVAATTGQAVIGTIDRSTGQVDVDAGVSLHNLLANAVPLGWVPPVLPGTAQLTVGGAFAADVHGKNHPAAGSFSESVEEIQLWAPTLGALTVSRDRDPATFWATAGGLGLTGVVRRLRLRLTRLSSSWLLAQDTRCDSLDEVLGLMLAAQDSHDHSVAWIDGHARGRALGRGVVSTADVLAEELVPDRVGGAALAYRAMRMSRRPPRVPVVRPAVIRGANALKISLARRASRPRVVSFAAVHHPLDAVRDWPRLYGRGGLLQYQFSVPEGGEEVLAEVLGSLGSSACPPSLVVLKRLGQSGPGHLSFPAAGWTLAIDLPAGSARVVAPLLDRADDLVCAARGRVYLVKDSRLRRQLVQEMYPRLDEWRGVRDRLDPNGVLTSDLDRRLDLTGRHGGRHGC